MAAEPDKELLPFVLPEFTRHSWVGERARSVWEPRIARVVHAWRQIEWKSVAAGLRDCGMIWVSPDLLPPLIPQWQAASLSAGELKVVDANGLPVATSGRICVLVGAKDRIDRLREAWAANDVEAVGVLFGYPPCCRAFFRQVWVVEGCIDTTWGMVENASDSTIHRVSSVARIEMAEGVPPLANILWRWLGVRAVPHLPCRLDCPASLEFGRRMLEVGTASGYAPEMEWIVEMLSWPVEWSALHGIAEVKSPLMKISTRTDATAGKRVVQWAGTRYPEEGATGLHFPFLPPKKPMLTSSPEYRRGMAHVTLRQSEPAWRHADNGFASAEAMDRLHRPIVEMARAALARESGRVLDLGCGNGALLAKVCEGHAGLTPFGIDANPSALEHARHLLPEFGAGFAHGDLFDVDLWNRPHDRYALALLMPGRLLEAPPDKAKRLLDCLRLSSSRVLLYACPDWKETVGDIARQLGNEVETPNCGTAAFLKDSGSSPAGGRLDGKPEVASV